MRFPASSVLWIPDKDFEIDYFCHENPKQMYKQILIMHIVSDFLWV